MVVIENQRDVLLSRQQDVLPRFLIDVTQRIIEENYRISKAEAMRIAQFSDGDEMLLFHYASQVRRAFKGNKVRVCSIVNAKSGACPEDCAFCAQSARYAAPAPVYPLLDTEEILKTARQAKEDGVKAFGIVISGRSIRNQAELEAIGNTMKSIRHEYGLDVHAAVGIMTREQIVYLKDCGMTMVNHNLETSERFFPSICTTHTYQERIATIRLLKEYGIKTCTGGIFGLGETLEDRVDMALLLRELDIDSVPMNFLHPIPGTPLMDRPPMPPMECLKTISLFRFVLPDKEIKVCGGRVKNLRDLQSMIFAAGASSVMIGNYLTTAGREPELDWQMLKDLGMEPLECGCDR